MGLFTKKKKTDDTITKQKKAPVQPKKPFTKPIFEHSYINLNTFRGTKKLPITSFDREDTYGAMANGMILLGENEELACIGQTITVSGFNANGYEGLNIGVDGYHLGTVWKSNVPATIYKDICKNNIQGVYVLLKRERVFAGNAKTTDRARGFLYVLLKEESDA